ncbi:MAG TPA: carbohydrate ABC transporter permease, partial [Symbiobacteriaceae bacterium]|nr:carbohydrate ABC transporter permease [Symbiobacteriaceae bacterium]
RELDEAAMVDGAGRWQVLWRIIMPIASPGLIAAGVFSFMASWNEFLFALVFTKTTKSITLPVIVATFTSDFNISFSLMNAAGVLAVIPPVVLALVFRRYLVDGLTRGAVKG